MNLILLDAADFIEGDSVRLQGRRRQHIEAVHRVGVGETLVVGLEGGRIGTGRVEAVDPAGVTLSVVLDADPPPPLALTLVLALPRPKVLNRVIASATSFGVKRIALINAWRVEKSYWKSPRLDPASLRAQCVAGLEQAKDTILPAVTLHRFFRAFVEEELPGMTAGSLALVAHPYAKSESPRGVPGLVTLVVGPEGGFIESELASLERCGFAAVSLGPRVLRVESAVAALIARLT